MQLKLHSMVVCERLYGIGKEVGSDIPNWFWELGPEGWNLKIKCWSSGLYLVFWFNAMDKCWLTLPEATLGTPILPKWRNFWRRKNSKRGSFQIPKKLWQNFVYYKPKMWCWIFTKDLHKTNLLNKLQIQIDKITKPDPYIKLPW